VHLDKGQGRSFSGSVMKKPLMENEEIMAREGKLISGLQLTKFYGENSEKNYSQGGKENLRIRRSKILRVPKQINYQDRETRRTKRGGF